MTTPISGLQLWESLKGPFPNVLTEVLDDSVVIVPESVPEVARHLKESPDLAFDYLESVTATDYIDYFEVVYHLVSLERNHSAVLKTRTYGRDSAEVPSVTHLWRSADLQEREVFDLMGVTFTGHPNLKRIMMWEGFPGHPLRKDFLEFDHRNIVPSLEN
ncbi:MAG: nuoC [Dehalococcoidia bacterium]|nr:nuoC [Dehalococcoidia bacterium]